jgi:mannose-6-phosphate isomerase-like protein (cupin superfamily)
MDIRNIEDELLNAPVDKGASVKIALLTGGETLSIYAAEVAPRSRLNPHYHNHGIETYQVYRGAGLMKTGRPVNGKAEWTDTAEVRQGDCFCIPEGTVHQIVNDSDKPLLMIFSCPSSHLGDDRYFVAE